MVATLNANYMNTTVAAGTFNIESTGYVQGMFIDDPAVRYQLAGGVLANSETFPMWGGVGINETVLPGTGSLAPSAMLGGQITRATSVTAGASGQLTGFSVYNQAYGMVVTSGSPVPLAASGMQVNFFRLGSNARIVVACAPSLSSLEGGVITQQVSWDYNAQMLVPYVAAYPANVITATSWATGEVTFTTTTAHGVGVGDYFSMSGFTPAGYNGDYVALTGTTGSTLVAALVTNPGAVTVEGTLDAGGGALPCKVLEILPGNSMTVDYNAANNTAAWNYQGTVALILI